MKKDEHLPLIYLAGVTLLFGSLYGLAPNRKAWKSLRTFLKAASALVLITDLAFTLQNHKPQVT